MSRVAVTGIGSITPLGNDFDSNWNNILNGYKNFKYYKKLNIVISEIDDDFNSDLSSKEIRYQDRSSQLAMISTREAIKDSGLSKKDLYDFMISVGTSIGGINTTVDEVTKAANTNNIKSMSIRTILKMLPNMISANLAINNSIHGPANTYSSACASGSVSIGEAYEKIKDGYVKGAVAVGVESCLNDNALESFKKLGVLSSNADIKKSSEPFCHNRDGFVISEGSCTLILEDLESAKKRGANIYCEIIGYSSYSDAFSLVAPDSKGMEESMKKALRQASISPSDINYINAHGTSTLSNDKSESNAICSTFNDDLPLISSTKSYLGHMLGGSGAIEAALCANMLKRNIFIGQNTPYTDLDDDLDIKDSILLNNKKIESSLSYIMSNSFAFGGTDSVLILKKL